VSNLIPSSSVAPVPNTLFGQPSGAANPGGFGLPAGNLPDLVVRFGATSKAGRTEIVVTNQGRQQAQGQIDIAVYASKDPFLDAGDGQIALLKKQSVNLAVGQSQTYGVNNLAKKLSGQDFFWIAAVDAQNAIKESDEGNNVAVWNTAVDPTPPSAGVAGFAMRSLASVAAPANSTLRKTTFWNNPTTGENLLWYTDDPTWTKTLTDNNNRVLGVYDTLPSNDLGWKFQTTGDFNGDGQTDILWRNAVTGAIQFWAMNGTTRTQIVDLKTQITDTAWQIQGAGDFDGDGRDDIVWRNYSTGGVDSGKNGIWSLQLNATTGQYDIKPGANGVFMFLTINDPNWKIQGVGDFNNDQKPDLIWRNTATGANALWLMNGTNPVALSYANIYDKNAPSVLTDQNWQMRGANDFNGDGKSDLVWQNQATGENAVWYMDSATLVTGAYLTRIGPNSGWQSYGPYNYYEQNATLAVGSDTGVSASDGITAVRTPSFAGAVSVGSTVSLFGNDKLIGQTAAAADGSWSLVAGALDDGVYTILQRVTNKVGGVTTRTLGQKLTIDGTAPDLTAGGVSDGIVWNAGDQLSVVLKDIDPQSKVEYQLKGASGLFSAMLDGPNLNIDGTVKTGTLSLKTLAQMGFTADTGGALSKRAEVSLKVTDRAGNVATQTLKGMALNLPDLTDDAYLFATQPASQADPVRPSTATGAQNPIAPVIGTGASSQYLFVGPGGEWGSAGVSTGGGTGGGGTGGGTIIWTRNATYNPPVGGTGGNTAPQPPLPTLSDGATLLEYVPGLELIFKTATEVLSNFGATAAKKLLLQNAQTQLSSTGRVVKEFGLYDVMDPILYGVYKKANVAGGITKNAAIRLGWEVAQKLVASGTSAKLQIFEAPLLAGTYGAICLNGGTVAATPAAALWTAVDSLARDYARLNPSFEAGAITEGYSATSFLDWFWTGQGAGGGFSLSGLLADDRYLKYMQNQFKGQASVIGSLQFVDRLIQAATQVEGLHQVVNGSTSYSVTYIKYGGFLRELTELGFEIARANPTTTAGVNPASEWIENLLEETGSGAGIRLAAEGLGQFFNGFTLDKSYISGISQRFGMEQLGQGLELATRSLKAVAKIPSYQPIAHDPIFLQTEIDFAKQYTLVSDSSNYRAASNSPFLDDLSAADIDSKINDVAAAREIELNTKTVSLPKYQPLSSATIYSSYQEAKQALQSVLVAGPLGIPSKLDQDFNISDDAWKISRSSSTLQYKVKSSSIGSGLAKVEIYDAAGNYYTGAFGSTAGNPPSLALRYAIQSGSIAGDYHQVIIRHSDGKIDVYDSDEPLPLRDGDSIFFAAITPAQTEILHKEISALRALRDSPVPGFNATWRDVADFISGAVYQYLFDVIPGSLIEIENFFFPWAAEKNKNTVLSQEEARLPQTDFFKAGRVAGSGAAILQGITELYIGYNALKVTVPGFPASLTGGPVGAVVGSGALLASVAMTVHGAAVTTSGFKSFTDNLHDLYERAKSGKPIENRNQELLNKLKKGEPLTAAEAEIAKQQSALNIERRKEIKALEKEIQEAKAKGIPGDSEDLLDLRYRQYLLENKDNAGVVPKAFDEWAVLEGRLRTNRLNASIAEDKVLGELAITNNNNLTNANGRKFYVDAKHGTSVPDSTPSKAWVEVKSFNRKEGFENSSTRSGILDFTQQLRSEANGAKAEGKHLVVVMTGNNVQRPSSSFTAAQDILKFDQLTNEWSAWDFLNKSWSKTTLQNVKSLVGN
jgi:Bacterial Ig-like domain/FG-GAP-like repeat/CARDB